MKGARASAMVLTAFAPMASLQSTRRWTTTIGPFLVDTTFASTPTTPPPYLTSIGMDRPTAALGVMMISIIGLAMRVMYGIMADMFGKKYVYALSNGMMTIALVLFGSLSGSSFAMLALFGVIYGLGISGAMTVRVPITREYFGIGHFGSVFGMLSVFTVVGGIIGAPVAGWVYDTSGNYFPIWYIFAGLTMVATILLLIMPGPFPKQKAGS